ncbi:MAG: hypothetical protein GYA21_06805 [Myxococcales bacterium]|nr:hypothetical protein [Myxococcales bacterium]
MNQAHHHPCVPLVSLALLAALCGTGCKGEVAAADAGQDAADASDAGGDPVPDGSADAGGDVGPDAGADAGDAGADGGDVLGDDGGTPAETCARLPAPSGTIVRVGPGQAGQLREIVRQAAAGTTILLEDGLYRLDGGDEQSRLSFDTPGVVLRSASGNPEAVILDGNWVTGELVSVAASDVTIAEVTLQRAYYHPIHVTGGAADIQGVRLYRVRVIDPAEQGIKINPSGAGTFADRGSVECCHIELTDAGRAQVRNNCYTGGIDGHQAWGWTVRRNTIRGFFCGQGLSEHAVHFWTGSRDTRVEENVIVDCARGIGFGLGESGAARAYPDDPYPGAGYIGHYDGVIRNNFVSASSAALFASEYGFDAGIALEQARGARVFHNSVFASQAPFSSIEWRFDNTQIEVKNNLVSHNLRERGGTATLAGNIEQAPAGWFVAPGAGDLHLASAAAARDAGVRLDPGSCDLDIDRETRDDRPDVGADEVR